MTLNTDPASIDHLYFPDIIGSIFAYLDYEGLQIAKLVCRGWHERSSAMLNRHLVLHGDLSIHAWHDGDHRPILRLTESERRTITSHEAVAQPKLARRLNDMFKHARVVDYPSAGCGWTFQDWMDWLAKYVPHQPEVTRHSFALRKVNSTFFLGQQRVFFTYMGDVADAVLVMGGAVVNVSCFGCRSIFDDGLDPVLPAIRYVEAPNSGELVVVFHGATTRHTADAHGRTDGPDETRLLTLTPSMMAEKIALLVSYRWRISPIVFVGMEGFFGHREWRCVWNEIRALHAEDVENYEHCGSVTALTHEEYKNKLGKNLYRLYTVE